MKLSLYGGFFMFNLVDEKNMTREELKNMDSILERVLGDLVNTL